VVAAGFVELAIIVFVVVFVVKEELGVKTTDELVTV